MASLEARYDTDEVESAGSVDTLDAEVEDDAELDSPALDPTVEPSSDNIKLENVAHVEASLLVSFKAEVTAISRNLENEAKSFGLVADRLDSVFALMMRHVVAVIAENGRTIFREETGETLTFDVAVGCLILDLLIGAYNTSPSAYFADATKEPPERCFLHPPALPAERRYNAWRVVLRNVDGSTQRKSDFLLRRGGAVWDRPAFARVPNIFQELNASLLRNARLLNYKGGDAFSEDAPVCLVEDDLLIAGAGKAFQNSYWAVKKIDQKAKGMGPHLSVISTVHTRLPVCIHIACRAEKGDVKDREDLFRNQVESILMESGLSRVPRHVRMLFDRGYNVEARIALKCGVQVIATMVRAHPRNRSTCFTYGPGVEKKAWAKNLTVIPFEGVRRAWWSSRKMGDANTVHMAFRDSNRKIVIMMTNIQRLVGVWVVIPDGQGALSELMRAWKGVNSSTTTITGTATSSTTSTGHATASASTQLLPLAPTSESAATTRTPGDMTDPDCDVRIQEVLNGVEAGFQFIGMQRTGSWRVHRYGRVSSTAAYAVVSHIGTVLALERLLNNNRTLEDVVQRPTVGVGGETIEVDGPIVQDGPVAEAEEAIAVADDMLNYLPTTTSIGSSKFWPLAMKLKSSSVAIPKVMSAVSGLLKCSSTSDQRLAAEAKKMKLPTSSPRQHLDAWLKARVKEKETGSLKAMLRTQIGTFKGTAAMHEGTLLEPSIRDALYTGAREFGTKFTVAGELRPNPFAVLSPIKDCPMVRPSLARGYDNLLASLDGIFVSGPNIDELRPRVLEMKLFQTTQANVEIEQAKMLGLCVGFRLDWDSQVDECSQIANAFAEPSHLFQTLHHMAITGIEDGVYCVASAVERRIIRLVLLHVPAEILDSYCEEMDRVGGTLMSSDLYKSCTNEGDVDFCHNLGKALSNAKSSGHPDVSDRGLKPAIVRLWNRGKNAQDVMQHEIESMRKKTSREPAEERMMNNTLLVQTSAAFRVYRCFRLYVSKQMDRCESIDHMYSEMNKLGSTQELVFDLARTFDPAHVAQFVFEPGRTKRDENGSGANEMDPNFRPWDAQWRERVTNLVQEVALSTGKRRAEVWNKWGTNAELVASRVGGSTAERWEHQKKPIADNRLKCVVCCAQCLGNKPINQDHPRMGFKIQKHQCSICLVALCDERRFLECQGRYQKMSCWEIWHTLPWDQMPQHPFVRDANNPSGDGFTPSRVNLTNQLRRKTESSHKRRSSSAGSQLTSSRGPSSHLPSSSSAGSQSTSSSRRPVGRQPTSSSSGPQPTSSCESSSLKRSSSSVDAHPTVKTSRLSTQN